MGRMLKRTGVFVVIAFSAVLLAGCTGILENGPREKANQAITNANESIAQHNKLFEQTRQGYKKVKEQIESGKDPAELEGRITELQKTMKKSRGELKDARKSLQRVQELDTKPVIGDYASLLSRAVEAQLAAEAKEIEFYKLLEKDPTLEDSREEARGLLDQADGGYQKAEKLYARARALAKSNPGVLGVDSPTTAEKTGGAS